MSSLIVHPAAMWSAKRTPSKLTAAGIEPGLVRFAAGVESASDLIADIEAALA